MTSRLDPTHPPASWDRLAGAIRERADELALSQRVLAERSGLSVSTMRSLMRGERYRRNLRPDLLERTLQWAPGSMAAVLRGEEPTALTAATIMPAGVAETMIVVDVPYADRLSAEDRERLVEHVRGIAVGWVLGRTLG